MTLEELTAKVFDIETAIKESDKYLQGLVGLLQETQGGRNDAKAKDDSAYSVDKCYFFQTGVYSYVGTISDKSDEWVLLKDANIVKLRAPLFDVLPNLTKDDFLPAKDLCLKRAYIMNHFRFECAEPLKNIIKMSADRVGVSQ